MKHLNEVVIGNKAKRSLRRKSNSMTRWAKGKPLSIIAKEFRTKDHSGRGTRSWSYGQFL